jgi:MSHA pilin protein MshA
MTIQNKVCYAINSYADDLNQGESMKILASKYTGFTLIELIIGITLLAILAIVAAPKYLLMKTEAKVSSLEEVAAAMKSGLQLVYSQAAIEGRETGDNIIMIEGVPVPLYFGVPSVDGKDSILIINQQLKAWLNIDSVDAKTANTNRNTADFFTAKSTWKNQIFIFFISDIDNKSTQFKCHVRYENPESNSPTGPKVTLETDDC